jgi:hypothetical protein
MKEYWAPWQREEKMPPMRFYRDRNVDNDVAAVRHLRVEVMLVQWLAMTATILILLINSWLA